MINPRPRTAKASAPRKQPPVKPAETRLSADLQTRLREAGLFPSLLPEVAASAYSEDELRALLEWCCTDQPERPAGLFMGRLRAGAYPPAQFSQPACPRCGLRGKHKPECPRRYALDNDYAP